MTKRQILLVSLAIGIPAILLIVHSLLPRNPRQQPPSSASADSRPAPTSIESVYQERYKEIVDRLNAFDYRTASEALNSLDTPPNSAHDLFIQGILFAWLGQDQTAAQRLTAAALLDPRPLSSPLLAQHAKRWRFDPASIRSRQFTVDDTRYIRRSYFFQRITDRIVSGCNTDQEKVERLLDWVFRHIAFFEPEPADASPMDILLRGYGLCDRSSWVLALLCERARLPVSLLLLGKPSEEISTHTLCQVLVSGRWLLCDTTHGEFVRLGKPEKPATLEEIILLLETEEENASLHERFHEFKEAAVVVVCEAEGVWPRFSLLEPYLRVIPPYPFTSVDLAARQAFVAGALPQGSESRKNEVGIWDYPFLSLARYRNPAFQVTRKRTLSRMLGYREARILQLLGFPDEAIQAYARSAEEGADEAREDLLFFIAQCFEEAGKLDDAEANFSLYLARHAGGRWEKMATYHLAWIKERKGDLEGALGLYQKISEIKVAKKRVSELQSQLPAGASPASATRTVSPHEQVESPTHTADSPSGMPHPATAIPPQEIPDSDEKGD